MLKTINIGDKEVKLKSSAAIPHLYRRKFNRDIFIDMARMQKELKPKGNGTAEVSMESMEMFEDLAYCFAKHADPDIPDNPEEWLEQFEMFDIYLMLPELIELWGVEQTSTSKLKKK